MAALKHHPRSNGFSMIQHLKGPTCLRLGSVNTPLHSYILRISREIFKALGIFASAYLDLCQVCSLEEPV